MENEVVMELNPEKKQFQNHNIPDGSGLRVCIGLGDQLWE